MTKVTRDALIAALDIRNLFCNPDLLDQAADEIDCCTPRGGKPYCEHVRTEWDTGASECRKSERGEYCPNDLAETLRELARLSRRDGEGG